MKAFKIHLINILLFVVLFVLYYITGFLLGYGSNGNYELESWWLYFGFIIAHLLVNFLILAKPKTTATNHIVISTGLILLLYGCMAYIFY